MKRGLVLGKFAPFHAGHQSLVERAIEQTDEVVVLVYDSPKVTRISLKQRAQWIRHLYPQAVVIEGHDAPADEGHDPRIMKIQEDYIRRVVPQPVTHFFSSEWYGAHVSRALGALDVRVDSKRLEFPVSGTAVRTDPYGHRQHVHPVVYRDLVRWIVLLGAESTGKTTLSRALAQHFQTVHVDEHGRSFWELHRNRDGQLSVSQLAQLASEHRKMEEETVLRAKRLLFCDTDARITQMYSKWYHAGVVDPMLSQAAEECRFRYHLTVLCGDEIPYVNDGTRAGPERRRDAQNELRQVIESTGVDWIEAKGTLRERVCKVAEAIRIRGLDRWF
jgi:NadR type nicotinamide-nucleotide adenylyltransferase